MALFAVLPVSVWRASLCLLDDTANRGVADIVEGISSYRSGAVMFGKLLLSVLVISSALAYSAAATAQTTLCDCMNSPIDSDAKVAACNQIFAAQDPATAQQERTACRNKPPPAGGPDICYCLFYRSSEPEVLEACQTIADDIGGEMALMGHVRRCAAQRQAGG